VTELPLLRRLTELGSPRVVVFGDAMLDEYWWGRAERLSPEGPVAVLSLEERTLAPGGAANVARNVAALGGRAAIVGAVGDDPEGAALREALARSGVDAAGLVAEPRRATPLKVRLGTRAQALLRVDRERAEPLGAAAADEVVRRLAVALGGADAVVVSDYAKGIVDARTMAAVVAEARARGVDVIADPKGGDADLFAGVTWLVPNERELRELAGGGWTDDAGRAAAARRVRERTGAAGLVLTRSEHGVEIHAADGCRPLPARAREVYDVTGAGDTFTAAFAVGLGAGWGPVEACTLANVAAGLKVGKRGTAVVTRAELAAACAQREGSSSAKLGTLDEVAGAVEALRRDGRRIVFTNGCFDLLHAGHVRYLEASRALGDCLVVGLNDDASVRALKGPDRPILRLAERAAILGALASVDYLVAFGGSTPLELIRRLRPDVLTKGADYALDGVVGADLVASWGGRVELLPLEAGASTTGLLERIRGGGEPGMGDPRAASTREPA
jgi:D-beta-D-heptose 7-phosphate kinase/D-beta-D-heptose 1-phosphate adenosyltransferase